jgi:hypothetical protein
MNTEYTDTQLKQALAKMLPKQCLKFSSGYLYWTNNKATLDGSCVVLDTELLHLCWLVEESLSDKERMEYACVLANVGKYNFHADMLSATWQQRVVALAKVKGVEIV